MHRFHTAALVAVALAGITSAASAADLPRKAPAIAPPPLAFSWTGFYIGANVGGGFGWNGTDSSVVISPLPNGLFSAGTSANPLLAQSDTRSPAGVIGGGQIGYNWQAGGWVLGVEGDFDGSGQRNSLAHTNFVASNIVVAPARLNYTDEQKITWLATARARLGWAQDRVLWYVTGGAAWGGVESNTTFQVVDLGAGVEFGSAPGSASFSGTRTGWTVGGGAEASLASFGLSNNWSAKLEYLYVDLGSVTNSFVVPLAAGACNGTPGCTYTVTTSTHIRDNLVRVGLNYRFATR